MQSKKIPGPSAQGEPGKRQKQKFYRPHSIKPKRKTPPRYNKKFDREILKDFATKYRGSLVGYVAIQQLRDLQGPRKSNS